MAPGVELSTGSLGHGLPFGVGLALHAGRRGARHRVFVIISDGECDEGTTWEAALLAAHHHLDGLTVVVDSNGIQSFGRVDDVIRLEPLVEKWRDFGWSTEEVDGHDHDALSRAFAEPPSGRPRAIIARTVKGQGVTFMQDDLVWHYRSPSDEQLAAALAEVDAE
jgi:transketolase